MASDYVTFLIALGLCALKNGDRESKPLPSPWDVLPPRPPSPSAEEEPPQPFPPPSIPRRKRSRQITLQGILEAKKEEEKRQHALTSARERPQAAALIPVDVEKEGQRKAKRLRKNEHYKGAGGHYVLSRPAGLSPFLLRFTKLHDHIAA